MQTYRNSGARLALVGLILAGFAASPSAPSLAQEPRSRTFAETGKTVTGRFLDYWERNGGLAQQGYPISGVVWEDSETDGKHYSLQYFERAVFEYHPENQAPNDVLLSLLGVFRYREKYPNGAPNQRPNTSPGSMLFEETGKRVGGRFLDYWKANGGLAQQGFPISDEFSERSDLDGKTYTVQYFERAVFELHPENRAPYDVLLSQLGTFRFKVKYPDGEPAGAPQTLPAPTATTAPAQPTPTTAPQPQAERVAASGNFDRQDDLHWANGTASVIVRPDGSAYVKLAIRNMANGPDLYVWVTETAAPRNSMQMTQGGTNLGKLKAASGETTYDIPAGVDPSRLKTVTIYCRQFDVIFSNASLLAIP